MKGNHGMPIQVLQVFDRPMCCSTGVCGPEVDDALVRFAADLDWLAGQGVEIQRFNPAQEPGAFVSNRTVRQALQERGSSCLPLVIAGSTIIASGTYPARSELLRAVASQNMNGGTL
jgi:hypothetical protein